MVGTGALRRPRRRAQRQAAQSGERDRSSHRVPFRPLLRGRFTAAFPIH